MKSKILILLFVVSLVAGMIVPSTASPGNGQGGPGGADDGKGNGQGADKGQGGSGGKGGK